MPELPEVETVARQLSPAVSGRRIERFRILDDLLRKEPTPPLRGRKIRSVFRLGKQVTFDFGPRPSRTDDPLWLLVHLRMTGRLIAEPEGGRGNPPHLRALFTLDKGRLMFIDTRRFGTFRWVRDLEEGRPDGVDPVTPEFTPERLDELLEGSPSPIKPWLLRQDRIVGLGNIYASEILHVCKVSPHRAAGSLKPGERKALHKATVEVLERAIENCGTTFSDFQDARGVEGSYQQFLAVYAREGEPCPRCKGTVEKIVQQQRSTFWCRGCQR
ncbi:hypothetical protein ABI59_20220 [Acidobacteria bacterium Mor1]|nr:hypothetical protein ABI59_20220 [Acidobacteria bacterium Mor1]